MHEIVENFNGFKKCEWAAFIPFFMFGLFSIFNGEYLDSLVAMCSCVWIFTSSGWRQISEQYMEMLDVKTTTNQRSNGKDSHTNDQ